MRRERIARIAIISAIAATFFIFQNCSKGYRNRAPSSTGSSRTSSNKSASKDTSIYTAGTLTPSQQAILLYQRLSGVTLNLDDPIITDMSSYINSRQSRRAAEMAVNSKEFYSLIVRDLAAMMSTRDSTPAAPMSDFVATFIGIVKDGLPATELLTGNYYYRGRGVSGVRENVEADIIRSNNHYEDLEARNYDYRGLVREDGQKILGPSGSGIINQPDPAGLLTSRAWMFAHANAGTNRRIIEYTMKIFLCSPIKEWANTTYPDSHVGRDIGRFPNADFKSKCKGCHTAMDGMRPATAHFDFRITDPATNAGYIKYGSTYTTDDFGAGVTAPVPSGEQSVPTKFRRAASTFPAGYAVKNDNWINYINPTQFGWKTGDISAGSGMNDLGKMMSQSRGFSQCLVRRVFASVCKQELTSANQALLDKLTTNFENDDYNLKNLFIDTAIRPECLAMDTL